MADAAPRANRLWLYLPFAVAAVLLFAYYLLWRAAAEEMKHGVADWVAEQRAAGLSVSHGAIKAEGFPFFLRVHVDAPDIEAQDAWAWRTERLTLDALPYDFNRLIFSVRSEQELSLAAYGAWRVRADDFRASVARDKLRGWKFAMTIAGAHGARAADGAKARAGSFVFDLAPDAADRSTLTLTLAASALALNNGEKELALDGLRTVMSATQAQALGDAGLWRAMGGALVISGLEAEAGASKLSVSGEISLDGEGYPAGGLTSVIAAPGPFITALGEAGVLNKEDAETTSAALTLAAIAGGGKIIAPLELKDGEARIANVTLARLPNLN
ncbi:MAG: DUF2125 domain-containing protein [Parvularculaceae bacterium]